MEGHSNGSGGSFIPNIDPEPFETSTGRHLSTVHPPALMCPFFSVVLSKVQDAGREKSSFSLRPGTSQPATRTRKKPNRKHHSN